MKLFASYAPFTSLLLTLLSASAVLGANHLEQVQPPGFYPHNAYTASYVWTQTTVDGNTHESESHTYCRIISSDGKGRLACESPGLMDGIQILDLPSGKFYQRSKYSQPVAKNSVTSYSGHSYLNEVMFTHDPDIFNDVTGMPPNPAPKFIGSKLIKGYQCEGWKLVTEYKIDEWWFNKDSKCLVLMESKPNPSPSPSINRMIFWLMPIFFGGPGQRVQTITERLDSFSKDLQPPSYFDIKGLSPVRMTVWKLVENEPVSSKK